MAIPGRWAGHLDRLMKGKHSTPNLQASYDKHGPTAFTFQILELCPQKLLAEREYYWMVQLRPALNAATPNYESIDIGGVNVDLRLLSAKQRQEIQRRQRQKAEAQLLCACGRSRKKGNRVCQWCLSKERRASKGLPPKGPVGDDSWA